MGWKDVFKRGNKLAEAKTNHGITKAENNNKEAVLNQAISDMGKEVLKANKVKSDIKVILVTYKSDLQERETQKEEWYDKAVRLKKKLTGEETADAPFIAGIKTALNKVENLKISIAEKQKLVEATEKKYDAASEKVKTMKQNLDKAKEDVANLNSRSEIAKAEKSINENMSTLNENSAASIIDRMNKEVSKEEAEAEALADMVNEDKSVEDSIEDLLNTPSPTEDDDLLKDFLK